MRPDEYGNASKLCSAWICLSSAEVLSVSTREVPKGKSVEETGPLWDIPRVTTTIDDRHRAVLKMFQPGDVAQIEQDGPDVVILRRMKPVEKKKPRLVKRNGELFSDGPRLTNEDVKRMLEDEP